MSKEFLNTFPFLHSNESLPEALRAARAHQKHCSGMHEMRTRQHAEVAAKAAGSPNATIAYGQLEIASKSLAAADRVVNNLEHEMENRARTTKPRRRAR